MRWHKRATTMALVLSLTGAGCGQEGSGSEFVSLEDNTPEDGEKVGPAAPSPAVTTQHSGNRSLTDLFSGGADPSVRSCNRWVKAHVVALDQPFTYNRWGAFNPVGMIFALKRDVESTNGSDHLEPGHVRLKENKRPRPLVLRVNEGDCLEVKFTNLLAPDRAQIPFPDLPGADPEVGPELPDGVPDLVGRVVAMHDGKNDPPLDGRGPLLPPDFRNDAPATRAASFHVNGLQYRGIDSDAANVGRNDSTLADPGETRTYKFLADKEGTFFAYSGAHLAGGEGDNQALASGLFAAVNVEPRGSVWYRSQVTEKELRDATKGRNADGTPRIDFDEKCDGVPILKILDEDNEIVHSDLNAIIDRTQNTTMRTAISEDEGVFREFTVIFHDEIEIVQAFPELENDPTLISVRDAFAINYGVDAAGPRILANRARIGPSKDCVECKFEEFFLTSWANGDPALVLEKDEKGKAKRAAFPDDPANVHHSYLGDPVRFRNLHAGPRESHIFHLHAHQWLHSPADDDSNYFDSQAISPGSGFTYNINFGGGGNRNFTVGDSIFHCHLYPHFAGGMWELWRNHDVFEDGSKKRNVPDGELKDGIPTPALVPLPGRPMPPMPTYEDGNVTLADGRTVHRPAFPGYPFYVTALAGHRPPQPPLDLEEDGGLPRHVVTRTKEAELGRRGDFDVELERINIKLLQQEGTPEERDAMAFHAGEFNGGKSITTRYGFPAAAYPAFTPEGQRTEFVVNGQKPMAGAPFANPCPPGALQRDYRVAHIQLDMVVNGQGWHDPQARIEVLNEDVEPTLNGDRPPEPLIMRVNSGECVVVHYSNLMPSTLEEDDFQIFTPTDTAGMHVHLVKFDVTSSDGSGNGFNYEDGSFAAEEVQERIRAANAAGGAFTCDGTVEEGGERQKLKARKHPLLASAPPGTQTTIQRWWADPVVNGQGLDRTLGTVFTHDHFGPSSHQQHGLYAGLAIEPTGSKWFDSQTGEALGTRDDGGPTAIQAVIEPQDRDQSYREFNLAFADFALLYDRKGKPINRPGNDFAPLPIAVEDPEPPFIEAISSADPGGMLVNYRNEPIPLRIARRDGSRFKQKNGPEGDMENVFSSHVHGDPFTPLLRAHPGDKVFFRLLEGAQEEFHAVSLNGLKWLHEYGDPDSGFISSQVFAISEHFEIADRLPPITAATADFLYQSATSDDLWNGTWGILRTYRDPQPDLRPLPGNPVFGNPNATHPVCPDDAPVRRYTVYAMTAKGNLPKNKLLYNERFHLYDPDGILYVLDKNVDDFMSGKRRPEPLVLRASAGDCIEVKLVNAFPDEMPKTPGWNFFEPITPKFNFNQVRPSNHAGLHPGLLHYDIRESDGANIGLNPVQTAAPGETVTYRWYAGQWKLNGEGPVLFPLQPGIRLASAGGGGAHFEPQAVEFGTVGLRDYADVVNHGANGGLGALIIEPKGSTWVLDEDSDISATVHYTDSKGQPRKFREFVVIYQDEIPLHSRNERFQCADPTLKCGTALLPYTDEADGEDAGHKGFSYRTEPLWARAGFRPQEARLRFNDFVQDELLDSNDFGEPETPIFEARTGDEVRFRVLATSQHSRVKAFTLHGHEWHHDPMADGTNSTVMGENAASNIISTQGSHGANRSWNILPLYGAGGANQVCGDFLYRDQNSIQFPDGMWGIFRVRN